ncbi:alanine--glyoxylate aminotransferase family protein [Tenacibaculum sp. Bg11-29]|uniref:pyridoxal-phosphate-dependent aminotransferase family protein n=1 Tax=Tenacibaculum sp. Bg11-29 TaxID=2058306 RepID=UPI000C33565E|nr:alanine--glyoxylate aminotransferase family protein [Tenacibaculum sp. Bg11-29]PKH52373.1 alanine--glyoxylate aminotransferase family protein [Tenacibaculum sp. Bg11-29]
MKSRKLLMIPGPIEFESEVLQCMAIPTPSHVDPDFIDTFSNSLKLMKEVFQCPSGQAFIVAGTGTLAMDMAAANLIEAGDKALVISTGYFGLRYAEILKRYGAEVDILEAELGDIVSMERIEQQLKFKSYKLLTFTHVDTSTAVLNDAKSIGTLGKKHKVLTVLDGVCSVAAEEIKQEEWDIDVVLTASQKAVGVPPGLALLVASQNAIKAFEQRTSPVANYYGDWTNWLPVMKAYEDRKASYFGTPAVNLVIALEKSLQLIVKEGLDNRFNRHQRAGKAIRAAIEALGLGMLSKNEQVSANALSAPLYPSQMDPATFLQTVNQEGIILAGGLLPELKNNYFRIGHMGSVNKSDLLATIGAIETALMNNGYSHELGIGTAQILKHF